MVTLFVPGRLCLFGEHSDWAGALRLEDPSIVPGACIVTGTDQGITATAEAAADFEMTSQLPDGRVLGPLCVRMDEDALLQVARRGEFFSYAAGVAAEMRRRFGCPGVRLIATDLDLPIQRGLSSSAAVCVMVARAFNQVHGLGLDVRQEMELAYRGELVAGSACGRMDQACAFGKRPVLLRFDGDAMDVEPLQVGGPLYLLIVDLERGKDTRRILADLNACFRSSDGTRREALRTALGSENAGIVAAARAALEVGHAARLGTLMLRAQDLFDRCIAPASEELTAPRLHAVLAHAAACSLTWGGKGVGSQGDGCAQLVCRGPAEREELAQQLTVDFAVQCLPLTIEPEEPR